MVYLCAFLPRNGDTLLTWPSQDRDSLVNPMTMDPRADGVFGFKPEYAREAFYGNCTKEDVAFAQARLVPQAGARLLECPYKRPPHAGVKSRAITLSACATVP